MTIWFFVNLFLCWCCCSLLYFSSVAEYLIYWNKVVNTCLKFSHCLLLPCEMRNHAVWLQGASAVCSESRGLLSPGRKGDAEGIPQTSFTLWSHSDYSRPAFHHCRAHLWHGLWPSSQLPLSTASPLDTSPKSPSTHSSSEKFLTVPFSPRALSMTLL